MRREYDFSKGVRGKFYRTDGKLLIPVYLEPEVQAFVADRAAKAGTGVSEVVNQMLQVGIAGTRRAPGKARRSAAKKSRRLSKR